MENAEEVMQLLEEFSKTKPKDIPRELEDYLCYVAKTGNPVYQWPLVKTLFREKLINVITDFYENTPNLELPPCPNVDPFNYERVKTSLIERFDLFSSAPFTVQRICELLTSPRKEYNRADKYMRAIEKNILVVSTREPGTGKRPYECDGQSETVLNGMPDVRINEADGSLLHLPTDLPYLGAPPASNDVTIETSEPNTLEVETEKVNLNHLELNSETKELPIPVGTEQSWQESQLSLQQADKSELNDIKLISVDRPIDKNDRDTSNGPVLVLSSVEHSEQNVKLEVESKCSSDLLPGSPKNIIASDLPDSIGSLDSSTTTCSEETIQAVLPTSTIKIENEELGSTSDENEVSSTPADDTAIGHEKINDPTDSEAEATGTDGDFAQETEPDVSSIQENEVDSRILHTGNINSSLSISEITANKSDDIELECNEISGAVESPVGSPENEVPLQTEEILKENILEAREEAEQCLDPDSSNDVSLENKISPEELSKSEQCLEASPEELSKSEQCSEADSMSDSDLQPSETRSDTEDASDQTNQPLSGEVTKESSSHDNLALDENSSEVCTSKTSDDDINATSKSSDSSLNSEDSSRDETVEVKLTEVHSSTEPVQACKVVFEPVTMQSALSSTPDSQQEVRVEQINVDPTCEAEEAMDVDDGSNQMMVSEGENESEPMDQGDLHS